MRPVQSKFTCGCVLAGMDLHCRWNIYMNKQAAVRSWVYFGFSKHSQQWNSPMSCRIKTLLQNKAQISDLFAISLFKCTTVCAFASLLLSTVKKNGDNLSAYEKENEKVPGAPPHYLAHLNAGSQPCRIRIIACSALAFHLHCQEYKVFSSTWKQDAISVFFKALLAGEWGHLWS